MTPEQYKQMIQDKGWDANLLASRWGFKDKSRIYQIIRDQNRAEHWNDALRGLPYIIENSNILHKNLDGMIT